MKEKELEKEKTEKAVSEEKETKEKAAIMWADMIPPRNIAHVLRAFRWR